MSKEVFFCLKNGVTAGEHELELGRACDFVCAPELKKKLSEHRVQLREGVNILTAFRVIDIIKSEAPDAEVVPVGRTVCRILCEKRFRWTPWTVVKVAFAALVLFFGGAVSLLYFHADVDMRLVLSQFYRLTTGIETTDVRAIGIPYSIGLIVGFLFLLNASRRRKEPSLLDLDQDEYEQQVQNYLDSNGDDANVV